MDERERLLEQKKRLERKIVLTKGLTVVSLLGIVARLGYDTGIYLNEYTQKEQMKRLEEKYIEDTQRKNSDKGSYSVVRENIERIVNWAIDEARTKIRP